jgi:hypothetical protein
MIAAVGFDVLIAVLTKSYIFWNLTPCSPLKASCCFGGTYRFYLQAEDEPKKETSFKQATNTEQCFLEISDDFQLATGRYIPEGRNLKHNFCF